MNAKPHSNKYYSNPFVDGEKCEFQNICSTNRFDCARKNLMNNQKRASTKTTICENHKVINNERRNFLVMKRQKKRVKTKTIKTNANYWKHIQIRSNFTIELANNFYHWNLWNLFFALQIENERKKTSQHRWPEQVIKIEWNSIFYWKFWQLDYFYWQSESWNELICVAKNSLFIFFEFPFCTSKFICSFLRWQKLHVQNDNHKKKTTLSLLFRWIEIVKFDYICVRIIVTPIAL